MYQSYYKYYVHHLQSTAKRDDIPKQHRQPLPRNNTEGVSTNESGPHLPIRRVLPMSKRPRTCPANLEECRNVAS